MRYDVVTTFIEQIKRPTTCKGLLEDIENLASHVMTDGVALVNFICMIELNRSNLLNPSLLFRLSSIPSQH